MAALELLGDQNRNSIVLAMVVDYMVNPHLGEPLYGMESNLFVVFQLIAWIIEEDHSLCRVRQSGHCISTVQC